MRRLISGVLSSLVALAFIAWPAHAADFEGPLVNANGGQVEKSEGKLDGDGEWKVEAVTSLTNTVFDICLVYVANEVPTVLHLGDATSDEDGELKAEGTLNPGTYDFQAPSFQVRGDTLDNSCTGPLYYETGLTVEVVAE